MCTAGARLAIVDHVDVGGWALGVLPGPVADRVITVRSPRDARARHALRTAPGTLTLQGPTSLALYLDASPLRPADLTLSDVPPASLLAALGRSRLRRVRVPGELVAERIAPALPPHCQLVDTLTESVSVVEDAEPLEVPRRSPSEAVVVGLADRPGALDARQFAHLVGLTSAAGKPAAGIIPRGSKDLGVALSYQNRLGGLFRVLTADHPSSALLRAADAAVLIRHPRDARFGPESLLRAWVNAHGVPLAEVTPVPPGHLRRAKSLALPVLEALGWDAATVPA